MKLTLVNPPEIAGFISDRDKAGGIGVARPRSWRTPYLPPTPPMDWLYAAAIAREQGVRVTLIDAIGHRLKASGVLAELRSQAPTHIGVRISMASLEEDLALANAIKREHAEACVFLFGHTSQTTYERWRSRAHLDAVLFGEVEALLMPLLRGETAPSILHPQIDPKPKAAWAYVQELDDLPMPAWDLVDRARYSRSGRAEDFVYYLLTSRGCPKGCSMCPYYVHQGKQWRHRSTESILGEIEALKGLGARLLQTRDPNISWRKAHLLALAEKLRGQTWLRITTETDLEALSESDLVTLREAGFVRIMTGVESVDPAILKEIHQNDVALKRSLANMALCQRLGIEVTGFFIVGSLQETWRSVKQTVETAKALPIRYSVSLMTPYFGTEMREAFIEKGYHQEAGFRRYNGYQAVVRTAGLDARQLSLAHAWASAELELVSRQREMAGRHGLQAFKQGLRVAVQAVRTHSLRWRAEISARQSAAQAPAQAAG